MGAFRALLKPVAERLLVAGGLTARERSRHRGQVRIVAYHNVRPDGEAITGESSLHIAERDFGRQLDYLAHRYDVVPLDDLLADDPVPVARRQRPCLSITFDDAYQGAVSIGVEHAARRGLPVTIFVPPSCLGRASFWWDAVDPAGDGGGYGFPCQRAH